MRKRMITVAVIIATLAMLLLPLVRNARADTATEPNPRTATEQTEATVAMAESNEQPAFTANQVDPAAVSEQLREQAQDKATIQDSLVNLRRATARAGEAIDPNHDSVKALVERGAIELVPEAQAAFAYVPPYQEPNDYAHRNYCGPGSAVTVLSHFDPNLPQNVDIDQIAAEMNMDPSMGVWIKDITQPVNSRVNQIAGQEVNWYRYGQAETLEDFRYMINVDIQQNGVPFITGLYTAGLPGWGSTDVGHIVAVYGYTRMPDGTEYVHYVDTAPASSGYSGTVYNTVELGQFWQAVSGNSAQVW